ncbi:MAG TPA: hypothetical protein PKJ41_20520 [Bryobacteraceae bacterium]|nr:hypothetical protein [Bryobacteraceae bacterium]
MTQYRSCYRNTHEHRHHLTKIPSCYSQRDKGIACAAEWGDAHASLLDAGDFVRVIEYRQGLKIACLEQIAFRNGWIDRAGLERQIIALGKSSYGAYLKRLIAN